MTSSDVPVRFGADCFSQHTSWIDYVDAMSTSEQLGYDSLWTPDHLLPTVPGGNAEGDILEAMMCVAAVAAVTSRATLGLLVSPITIRNPAVLTKMVTTLDHISGGRAVLGLGAGWAEEEHRRYGLEFGDGFGERLRWLGDALPVMRAMLDGTNPSSSDGRYAISEATNLPPPMQERLPILIGGSGPKVTLRLVAEHADMCNLIGPPDFIAERDRILVEHCEAVGRDPDRIERTVAFRQPVIRDDPDEARSVAGAISERHGIDPPFVEMAGTVDMLVDRLSPYAAIGYRHMIFQFLAPFDRETMERLVGEVRPRLATLV